MSILEARLVDVNDVWLTALVIRRDYPMIANIQTAFGLTDEQIDDMFIEAAGIK